MPFQVANGCFSAEISNNRITRIARTDMNVWEKIKSFFCSTNKPEALELIRHICHPAAGTTREEMAGRFEQLRTLAYGGFEENVQSGRYGGNHFCILDENSREILSVTLDDAGKYTVKCQEDDKTHNIIPDPERGEDSAEQAKGASGTLRAEHTAATTAPQTAPDYETVWSEWEKAAPAGESPLRAEAVQKMRDCLNNGNSTLDLYFFDITTLPDHLPPNITCLNVAVTSLTRLPEKLPTQLQQLIAFSTPLTDLPALPSTVIELSLANNEQLTSLPPLPSGLQKLFTGGTPLTSLPALPSGLKELRISVSVLLNELPPGLKLLSFEGDRNTRLFITNLPSLPHGLQSLTFQNTSLTSLPPLPSGLQTLNIYDTPLSSLPTLPRRLQRLAIRNTSLARLPESITHLPTNASVVFSGNPLSVRTLQDLEAVTSAPDYSGPRIEFDMAGPAAPRETRLLHLAVADWLAPAKEGEPIPTDRWQSSGQEQDAAAFSAFLDRLSGTENCKKDPGFKAQISSWLTQLAEDDELRAKTFAMATEATSSCEDRVTLALNQMRNVQLVHDAEKGKYDNNLPGLVSAGREMFRLEKLEQIARDKVKTLRFVDEIEVYLGYQNKLKKPLELSSVTAEMRFFGVSGVTGSDLQAAELQVKTAEDGQFGEWILQWAPLHSVLERAYPEDWKTLNIKKISDYDNSYRTLLDTELKPAGLIGNADAEREIGARALDSAEKAFLDGLGLLANKMLGGHLKARWS